MKIATGIIFYNDRDSLSRCLRSIHDNIDKIFAIDGRFPTFPDDSELSTDGSRRLVKSYSKCILVDYPRLEFDKRQKYLELCREYRPDILIIIDSDEYILSEPVCYWGVFHECLERMIIER